MQNFRHLAADEKLQALRAADPRQVWESLDEHCTCILCERTFSGRQIEMVADARGGLRPVCPTPGCAGSPNEWVHPGNPLLSKKAWRDWERVLDGKGLPQTSPSFTTL